MATWLGVLRLQPSGQIELAAGAAPDDIERARDDPVQSDDRHPPPFSVSMAFSALGAFVDAWDIAGTFRLVVCLTPERTILFYATSAYILLHSAYPCPAPCRLSLHVAVMFQHWIEEDLNIQTVAVLQGVGRVFARALPGALSASTAATCWQNSFDASH